MDIEAALETQRFRLLRLLAGLVFALRVVSFAPAGSMMPHWVRRYVSAVLLRAELAAQCLVFATARMLFGRDVLEAAVGSAPALRPFEDVPENGFSIAVLVRRIAALQKVLSDLPRYAKRLVKRCLKAPTAPVEYDTPTAGRFSVPCGTPDTRIDRPPDEWRSIKGNLLPRARRVGDFWRGCRPRVIRPAPFA